ncbi:MAG: GNAT family N-acetyltransferase [Muribaculaceae bacterium]
MLSFGSERLLLRPWRETDAEILYYYAKDEELGPRAGWAPHKSVEESREIIRTVFHNPTTWAIVLRESGKVVGAIGYGPSCECDLPAREGELTVGYWIGKDYWNSGICTEALQLLINRVVNHTKIQSFISGHYVDNPASGRVMEKCGFVATGELCTSSSLYGDSNRVIRVLRWER